MIKGPFSGICSIIPEDSVLSHNKGCIWGLSKSIFKGCLPLVQILWCLCLKLYYNVSMRQYPKFKCTLFKISIPIQPNTWPCVNIQIGKMSHVKPTLRVNARPSRPSGNRTVNSFLSSRTTTLQKNIPIDQVLN